MKPIAQKLLPLLLTLCLLLSACGGTALPASGSAPEEEAAAVQETLPESGAERGTETDPGTEPEPGTETVTLETIPAYSGEAYVAVNGNQPYFGDSDYTTEAFETYSELDALGRCGVAYANICLELMPTEDRESISQITPTGWQNAQYDFVDGGYIYNRCHLIGFQLAGENANEKNLITGTRYLNIQGMLPFENLVADYVQETEYHVLYRVTPVFEGDNLLASGVLMEGWSVEDEGEGVCFCVYAYNVQPGVEIDYAIGENWAAETQPEGESEPEESSEAAESTESSGGTEYVLNTNSHKFHYPDCSSVSSMSESNKQLYTGSREELIAQGYDPCGICKP